MPKPNHDTAELRAVALKAVTRIFAAWELSDDEAATLLDMPQPTWQRVKAGLRDAEITEDQLLRISALVGIYKALGESFGEPLATEWISRPNTGPLFRGKRPIDRMLAGGLPTFLTIRRYLEALPGGNPIPEAVSMHPTVAESMEKARERAVATARWILDAPDMLTVDDAAELMGASGEAVLRAVQDNTLLAVEMAGHDPRLPAWQFDSSGCRRAGLVDVLHELGNGWPAFRFFGARYQGVTNRERLMSGDLDGLKESLQLWVSPDYG